MEASSSVGCNCNLNFESCFFKPAHWCHRQWRNLLSSTERECSLTEVLKRILLAVPLILATLISYLASIPGFLTCMCNSQTIYISGNSWNSNVIVGSNVLATKRFNIDASNNLRAIELRGTGDVTIVLTERDHFVELKADNNLLDCLEPRIENQSLVLSNKTSFRTNNPISYRMHLPAAALGSLIVSGSGSLQVESLKIETLRCEISGSGNVVIGGQATSQEITISGSGDYRSSEFQVQNSRVNISGAGDAYIHTNRRLDVNISGAGTCRYSGNPPEIHPSITGAGSIAPL